MPFMDTVVIHGYRDCLHEFDQRLPEIIAAMREDDLLMILQTTGMIQLMRGTDHTREYIPFLAYSPSFKGKWTYSSRSFL